MTTAHAAVVSQLLHMAGPASAPLWVLIGLLDVELGDLQKRVIPWIVVASLAFIIMQIITGTIPISI